MTDRYQIDFSDQVADRQFVLAPYTTNGPRSPITTVLDGKATSARTTLLLHGKGVPDYGERIQENLIHVMENFAGTVEPTYPVNGQMWFDRTGVADRLRVYNAYGYEIIPDPAAPISLTNAAIELRNPTDSVEESQITARLAAGNRLRITDFDTGVTEDYVIQSGATKVGNNMVFEVLPSFPGSPSRFSNNWFVGTWEYVLQNNAPIGDDWYVNGSESSPGTTTWTFKNLPTPTDSGDAATKAYVDAQIASTNELNELDDVTIGSPNTLSDNDILYYDNGSGQWLNVSTSNNDCPVVGRAGSTMTGFLTLNANPTANLHAATKQYVDSAAGAIATLSDVNLSGLAGGDLLVYDGAEWVNQDPASNTAFVPLSGSNAITGRLRYSGLGVITGLDTGNTLVDKEYVDTIAFGGSDIYVRTGTFDATTQELTLDYSTTGSPATPTFGPITIDFTGVGGDTSTLIHELGDGNTDPIFTEAPGVLAFEKMAYTQLTGSPAPVEDWDEIPVNKLFKFMSEYLGRLAGPRPRLVFTMNNGGSPGNNLINLGLVGSPNIAAGQVHDPLPDGGPVYVPGFSQVSIYRNGLKLIASEHGYRDVTATSVDPGLFSPSFFFPDDFNFYESTQTGLAPGTTYDFDISVNGQAAVTINVPGDEAQRIGDLVSYINGIADANYEAGIEAPGVGTEDTQYAFGAVLQDGAIFFYSSIPGSSSSIDLTDGTTPLFSSMTGDALGRGLFSVNPLNEGETNALTPIDGDYSELGRVGRESQYIEFNTPYPSNGDRIELIIDYDMFYDRLP